MKINKGFLFLAPVLLAVACLIAVPLFTAASRFLPFLRAQPSEVNQTLFQGIEYTRQVRQSPRPMVVHIVTVDLRQEGIEILVTPGDPDADLPLRARTTSAFLEDFDLQLAINGDGVTPWRSNSLLDYYPHSGDPVDPIGFAASRGIRYSELTDAEPVLYISRKNRARFKSPLGGIYNAISGNAMLVEKGQNVVQEEDAPQPRTAVALDRRARKLIIVVVDGRQPGYSEGASLAELAEILINQGGYHGMNMDGGGSTTLVMEGKNGRPEILNSPIDQQIPGRERPVGNHLGVFAQPAGAP